jgi:23S rRNA (guanosine2251-2'-O)-methyltransferase
VSSKIVQVTTKESLQSILPQGAVHQGIAFKVQPLQSLDLSDLLRSDEPNQILVILDQVSDPHNVGAILRSCAVFGAKALVLTDRNAPKESATLAKTASGAMEFVPMCFVKNLANSLKELKAAGFWCVAFAEEAKQTLAQVDLKGKIALVMGAEGDGIRRLTAENCDFYVKLDSTPTFSTLNVSNAAAIALYETYKQQRT